MRSLGGALTLALLATRLVAQEPIPPGHVTGGTLSFDGRASVGDFTGVTHTVSGEMTGGATMAEVTGFVEAPVNTLVTGNGKRDRDLNKSMESDKYPNIRFDLKTVTVKEERGDTTDVVLGGDFIIHGVTRAVELPSLVVRHDGSLTVTTSCPLNLKDYQIGGLSKLLGILKMYEDITVHVEVTFGSTPT